MTVLLDKDIAIAMKLALEYNAAIIALATAYYGNMDSRIAQKNFRKNLKEIQYDYNSRLNEALDMVEDESEVMGSYGYCDICDKTVDIDTHEHGEG